MDKHEFATMIADNEEHWAQLAAKFEVAVSTVRRWAIGVSRPHPRMQNLIREYVNSSTRNKEPK